MACADRTSILRCQLHMYMRIKSLMGGWESPMSLLVSGIINMKLKCPPLTNSTDDGDAIEGTPSGIQVIG
jgi:hypothetical protein